MDAAWHRTAPIPNPRRALALAVPLALAFSPLAGAAPTANALKGLTAEDVAAGVAAGQIEFIHIPKNAGTSVENLGASHGYYWGLKKAEHDDSWPEEAPLSCSKWHVPRGLWQAVGQDPYAGKQTFCLTRHTYTRTISEFILRTAYDNGCLWPLKLETCDLVGKGACSPDALNSWVASKVEAIGAHIKKAANNYPETIADEGQSIDDCHWLPQWMYVDAGNATLARGSSCDNVLHFEGIDSELRELLNRFDPALGADPISNYTENAGVCTMAVSDLNDASRALLEDLYARDFEMFGFVRQKAGSNSKKASSKKGSSQLVSELAKGRRAATELEAMSLKKDESGRPGEGALDEDQLISLDGPGLAALHRAAAKMKTAKEGKAAATELRAKASDEKQRHL